MNEKLKENIHLWNSALVEEFMAKNNEINSFIMAPSLFAIVIMIAFSVKKTHETLITQDTVFWGPIFFVLYWLIELILAGIILYSFIKNERIRRTTDFEFEEITTRYINDRKEKTELIQNAKKLNSETATESSDNRRRQTKMTQYTSVPSKSLQVQFPNSKGMAFLSGTVIFCMGFGMMLLLWWNYQLRTVNISDLPGLFHYRAATLGDAICLPLMVGSAFMLLRNKKLNVLQTKKCLILSAVGMLIGVALQASWLMNPNINLNWTIPKPHYFNLAGWYHAFFFVVMFGVFTFLAASIIFLRKELALNNISVRLNFYLYTNAITLFGYLYLLDDVIKDKDFTPIVILFLASLVVQFVFLFFSNATKSNDYRKTRVAHSSSSRTSISSAVEGILLGVISGIVTLGVVLVICELWR